MIGHNLRRVVDGFRYRDDPELVADAVADAVEREAARLVIAGQAERAEAFKVVAKWMSA